MHKKRTVYILEKLFIRLEDFLKTPLKPAQYSILRIRIQYSNIPSVKCLSPLLITRENYFVIKKHLLPT